MRQPNWCCLTSVLVAQNSAVNELRATQVAKKVAKYVALCGSLNLKPALPSGNCQPGMLLTSEWVSRIYEIDVAARSGDITCELLAGQHTDIASVDWTRDVAVRCKGKWMFNVLDSDGNVIASLITTTTTPAEVEPVMQELRGRGVASKIVYVDNECCGVWQSIIGKVWPNARVVLDSFHAIRRLTQTTSSTRHPWHKQFCTMLSNAIFGEDAFLSSRFRKALQRSNLSREAGARLKRTCVPRSVKPQIDIEKGIERAVGEFTNRVHPKAGPLLTAKTFSAWSALKLHVRTGCICDPPDVKMHVADAKAR